MLSREQKLWTQAVLDCRPGSALSSCVTSGRWPTLSEPLGKADQLAPLHTFSSPCFCELRPVLLSQALCWRLGTEIDLCHPQSSFALTQLPSCFPSPAGSIFELCLLAALASPCHPMTGTGLEKGNEPSLSAYGAPGTCTRCLTYILKSLQQSRKV